MSRMADQIASQVTVLRKIAAGQAEEKGQYAAKLQSAASDTAGQLEKVTGRYKETASALTAWVPELETAQVLSLWALSQAQEAQGRQRANQPVRRPHGTHLTAADHQEDKARSHALAQANADLAEARERLAVAVRNRDHAAAQTASRIRSAISADTDSYMDDAKAVISSIGNWVKDHWVPILKGLRTALEVVAAILAVVALCIPGVNLVAGALAMVLTETVADIDGILAATGHGSWRDFVTDKVACLTAGLGDLAPAPGDLAKMGLDEGLDSATTAAEAELEDGVTAAKQVVQGVLEKVDEEVHNLGFLGRTWRSILAGGDLEDWVTWAKIDKLAEEFPDNEVIQKAFLKGSAGRLVLSHLLPQDWLSAIKGLYKVAPDIASGWQWVESHLPSWQPLDPGDPFSPVETVGG